MSVTTVGAGFGISPADITFEHLTPGITVEKEFLLSRTDIEKDVRVVVETDIEGANEWVRIEPGISFTIPKGERTGKMKVLINVPEEVSGNSYRGHIYVKALEGREGGNVALVKGVGLAVNLLVIQLDVEKLLIRKMEIPDTSEGRPIRLLLTVENQGNKDSAPDEAAAVFYDLSGKKLFESKAGFSEKVGPSRTQVLVAEFVNELAVGQYSAEVSVDFKEKVLGKETIVFNVGESEAEKKMFDLLGRLILFIALGLSLTLLVVTVVLRKRKTAKN
jgi:hypothetical protein